MSDILVEKAKANIYTNIDTYTCRYIWEDYIDYIDKQIVQKRGRCFLFVKSWFGHPYIYNSDILLYMNKINKIRIFIAGLKKFYVIKVLYNKIQKEFQRSKVVFLIFDGKMKTCLTLSLLGYLKTRICWGGGAIWPPPL